MKIAVLGYGTIGSGVVEIVNTNAATIAKRAGEEIEVKYVLDLRDFPGDPVQDILVHDYSIIAQDEDVDIIVETMGGTKPAYDFVKTALLNGKSVCSSNKELVAAHGAELLQIAREKNVNFYFEASVGGGIPIIRPLNQCITDFDVVLKQAQELGYAEKDPTADVEGYDACRKIAILTSLAYGQQVDYQDIYTEGITKITAEDFEYAKKINAAIKIFGTSKKVGDNVYAMVAPQMVYSSEPLYSVNGVFNAISVTGNMLGEVMFYGAGAGKLPTASAVVADVVDATIHKDENVPVTWESEKLPIAPMEEMENAFFVRVAEADRSKITELFGDVTMIDAGIAGECGFITPVMKEKVFAEKAEKLTSMITRIRVNA